MMHNWGNHGMGDSLFGLIALLPILFWLGIFVLLIVLIVRLAKNKPGAANDALMQRLDASEKLQQESLRRQQELADDLKEVKEWLQSIEKKLDEKSS